MGGGWSTPPKNFLLLLKKSKVKNWVIEFNSPFLKCPQRPLGGLAASPYNKITGCMSVYLSVSLYRRISPTEINVLTLVIICLSLLLIVLQSFAFMDVVIVVNMEYPARFAGVLCQPGLEYTQNFKTCLCLISALKSHLITSIYNTKQNDVCLSV